MGLTGRKRWRATPAALLASVIVLTVQPLAPVSASELEESAERPVVSKAPIGFDRPGGPGNDTSSHFWVWSKGARGYFLRRTIIGGGYNKLAAVDLKTGQPLGEAALTPDGYVAPGQDSDPSANGNDRSMVVDDEGGLLFVATQSSNPVPTIAAEVVPGDGCLRERGGIPARATRCFTGVSVYDAATLEKVRDIPFNRTQLSSLHLGVQLLSMQFTPAAGEQGAKIHVLVEEMAHGNEGSTIRGLTTRPNSLHLISLVQFDVDSGRQEWATRLDPCRGGLAAATSDNNQYAGYRHQAAIYDRRAQGENAIYIACHLVSQSLQGGVVRVPLDDAGLPPAVPLIPVPEPGAGPEATGASPDAPPSPRAPETRDRVTWVAGPDRVHEMMVDPESGRVVMQVLDGSPLAEVWWVFDTSLMRFVGTVGVGGPTKRGGTLTALHDGQLYLLARPYETKGRTFAGGLFVADVTTTPVGQALVYPQMGQQFPGPFVTTSLARWAITPQRLANGTARFWHPEQFEPGSLSRYIAFDSALTTQPLTELDDYAGRTLDLEEAPDVTATTMDGAARGYGARALLVAGVEAATRVGPADPLGTVDQCNDDSGEFFMNVPEFVLQKGEAYGGPCYYLETPAESPCTSGDREIVLAAVGPEGPSVLDDTGARGAANPLRVDSMTATDAEAPVSRCTARDWQQLWTTGLFGSPPVDEPKGSAEVGSTLAECVSTSQSQKARAGDPVLDGFTAAVDCSDGEASGHSYARGFTLEGVSLAEALSSFRIYRDPVRGIVSRVESVARGVDLAGLVRIDTVRGVAESWANGRRQPLAVEERDPGYDPNCDSERTAGTCFTRHLMGVRMPGYRCGPCGDEHAFLDAANAVLGPAGLQAVLREPDQRLRKGAENGFTAAIQKPEADRFGDLVLNNDLLQTVLPTFEVIRQAPPNRYISRMGARGRQIYQFAGVEVSSSYGIQCLLVYDEAANTCAEPAEAPGSIQVSLSDTDGKPLAGGAFEVRQDVDADGVLGLKDTLLPDGACVTAEDGIGTCTFDNLQPGTYLVSQVAAPPGYAKSAEPWVSEVASGEQRTVAFTNVSNVSTIDLTATDENGAPISGATFAAYPDPDSDGKVAPDAKPAAECTTDAQGVCQMNVPAGSYVLVQTSAPGGLQGIEPVPFTFASGGQVASVTVVNYPPAAPEQPAPAAAPIDYSPPLDYAPPVESVSDFTPVADTPVIEEPAVSVPERIGGTVTQVIRAPGDALRLLARDPKQAVAWTAALALFVLAAMAVRRRQTLASLAELNR